MEFKDINLPNQGIYQVTLDESDVDHIWNITKKYSPEDVEWDGKLLKHDTPRRLTWGLFDDDKKFQENVLQKVLYKYLGKYGLPIEITTTHEHKFTFNRFWCNCTTTGQYQALHDHDSIFSFVIWLHVPYDADDERAVSDQYHPQAGEFGFVYTDITGRVRQRPVDQSKCHSGTMLFFPSTILHQVFPFFSTKEYRITCSGDISFASQLIKGSLNGSMFDLKGGNLDNNDLERLSYYSSQEFVVGDPLFKDLNQIDIDKLCSASSQSSSHQKT
tara:strand:- start:702 stop:1520 length:819 start_codon:yes stop_codon:yes gene_type:complete